MEPEFLRREAQRDRKDESGDPDPGVEDYDVLEGESENQAYRQELKRRGLCRDCERPLEPERANNSRCQLCALIRQKRTVRRRGGYTGGLDRRIRAMLAGRPDPGPKPAD